MTVGLDDIVRTTVSFRLGDASLFQNVFYHQRIGSTGFTNAQHVTALADHFQTAYAHLTDRVDVGVVPALSYVDKVEFVAGEWTVTENIGTFTMTFVGTDVSTMMPNQCSAYVLYKTARPKTVGRKFLFPFTKAYYTESIINGTLVSSIVDFATDSLVDVFLGVIDDLEAGVPRTGVDAWYPFDVAIVTNVVGSQRRRRPGVGA